MTKTKSSLLLSAISLLLCVSMLIGTTFAWFTDSVTSSNNIIKSGTLKVQMEWRDASGAVGTQTTYKDASSGAIFNSELWEPGYTDAKNIKISNIGTLALKYHLNIAPTGDVSELAKVIDVFFAEGELIVGRDLTGLTRVGTLADILAGMPANMSGDLKAEKDVTVTIALKMKEEAGNEYQELSIGSDFAVVLLATQDNVEPDSIDKDYDDIEIPKMSIEKVDGVTYGTTIDNDYVMISVDDYTLTSHNVDENVTILGTGDGVNDNDRVFGKNAPLESLTLPEGLVEIKDNALNALPNLTTVNFPSTLKTIGIQSFRTTGMSSLTIPENVETIKQGAFRDMANLTTVTVEGNVAFENYAFRSCPNLTSIYLLGDDVTFSGSQFATHGDNGDANGITIYVKNATVAARVYAAQDSAYGYEVKILGDATDGSDAGDVEKVKNDTELNEAITEGASVVILDNGEYSIPDSAMGKELTIVGNGSTKIKVEDDDGAEGDIDYSFRGSNVTFENVTLNIQGNDYPGYAGLSATYNNCTIVGSNYTLYGDSVFNNCTFNLNNGYVWTWGASKVEFNGCTFEDITGGKAKAILVHNTTETEVTVKDCTFIATTSAQTWDGIPVAAVSVDPENGSPDATVKFEGTNTYSDAFYGLYQVKYSDEVDDVTIYVNGEKVEVTAMK